MQTEGVTLDITPEAIDALPMSLFRGQLRGGNIGARRLQTVIERVLDEISFAAPDRNARSSGSMPPMCRSTSAISPERRSEPVYPVTRAVRRTNGSAIAAPLVRRDDVENIARDARPPCDKFTPSLTAVVGCRMNLRLRKALAPDACR